MKQTLKRLQTTLITVALSLSLTVVFLVINLREITKTFQNRVLHEIPVPSQHLKQVGQYDG